MATSTADGLRESVKLQMYSDLLRQMQFNIQRRVNISTTIQGGTKTGLTVWFGVFGLAKFLPPDHVIHGVTDIMAVWIPYLGMLECLVLMAIARSVYQDEIDFIMPAVEFEDESSVDWGTANKRYNQLFEASYLRGSTSEAAGVIGFAAWLVAYAVARYYL